jgi:hypothetical protein
MAGILHFKISLDICTFIALRKRPRKPARNPLATMRPPLTTFRWTRTVAFRSTNFRTPVSTSEHLAVYRTLQFLVNRDSFSDFAVGHLTSAHVFGFRSPSFRPGTTGRFPIQLQHICLASKDM